MRKNRKIFKLHYKTPTILTCLGAAGVIATSILSSKATLKVNDLLKQTVEETNEPVTRVEVLKIALPIYTPSILIGVSTITCIFGANVLNKKNQAALMSAYALIDNSFKEYRKKLIELHGKEIDEEVREAMAREHCNYHQIGLDIPDKKVRFYEPISDQYFYAYEREVMDAEYHLNRNFIMRGYSPFNEFLEFLGLSTNDENDKIGWACDYGYCWLDFEHRLVKDRHGEYYKIVSMFSPDDEYLSQWE